MIKNASLKAHILLPLALVLAILLGAFHYSLYQQEKIHTERNFEQQLQAAKNYYARALTGRSQKLGAALPAILRDEPLQAALRARDRKALLKRSAPLFKALHDEYGVTHFYFEDAARVNLLRVHQPERYGDTINRYTTLTAEKTGKGTSGVELGPSGTFTLRVVAPMHDSRGLVGYVELGEEIEGVLQGVHDIIGTDLALIIDKRFLVRKDWERGMRMLKRNADWDRLPDAVIVHQTLDLPRDAVLRLLSGNGQPDSISNLNLDNKPYHAGVVPVKDAAGRKVGSLLILQDMALKSREMEATLRNLRLFYLALVATLFALFFLITRRAERRLEHSRQPAITQSEEREALQAKHIAELQDERDQLQRTQEELQQSQGKLRLSARAFENSTEGMVITDIQANILQTNRAFAAITGYTEEDVAGKNINILHSGRHGPNFYQEMWSSLVEFGYWQGEIWNRRKNGEIFPEWLTLIAVRDGQGETINYVGVFADLSEKKQTEARAHYFANYDANTDLPNRFLLGKHLQQELERAKGNDWQVALLYLDLDRFKAINDTLGHRIGDKLLKAVAERIGHLVRDIDIIGRLSSDEFTIVLSDVGNQKNAEQIAKKILAAMNQPFEMEGQEVFITPSIGIALYPQDADSQEDLIRNADAAMVHIKAQGGNGYHFYSADMNVMSSQRLTMETQLRRALERNEFVLHYQPQLSLHSGRIIGMEALLRWQHPERGLVSPAEFIPLLEETGMIVAVGDWVLRTACAQNSAWLAAGLPSLRMAVNLSARQFRQRNLIDSVNQALQDAGLAPAHLELEITESILIQDLQTTITTLNQLHELGIQISIDDFGTGYSSLSYLKRLPISKIKIDQSFIRDICTDPDDEAISNAVISLGHNLKMQVIAEGVETLEQQEHLRMQGCDEIQGYYFSRPLPAADFARLVRKAFDAEKKV